MSLSLGKWELTRFSGGFANVKSAAIGATSSSCLISTAINNIRWNKVSGGKYGSHNGDNCVELRIHLMRWGFSQMKYPCKSYIWKEKDLRKGVVSNNSNMLNITQFSQMPSDKLVSWIKYAKSNIFEYNTRSSVKKFIEVRTSLFSAQRFNHSGAVPEIP